MKVYQNPRYHEWRWKELVGPLVEPDGKDRMLLDLGCNAGFYMRKAQRFGYKTLGIEMDDNYISQAPKDLEIIKGDVNFYKPHCAYLTLMCCLHYHQSKEQVEALFHNMMYSTVYLLVMGRHRGRVKSRPDRSNLMNLLKGWELRGSREAKAFYTVLVKNPRYDELSVDDLYDSTREFVSKIKNFDNFVPSFEDFVRRTLDDINFDPSKTDFVKYLNRRRLKYPLGRCWIYKVMIEELKTHGIHTALRVKGGRIEDGYHRLIILKELGYKRVVCRVRG